jgi:cytidylate kinase
VTRRPIVAIDGPAGSGKSSTAKAVAERLGLTHLDSGAVYRAMTLIAIENVGGSPGDWSEDQIVQAARARGVAVRLQGGFAVLVGGADAGPGLRGAAVTKEVSRVAAMPGVRKYVNGILRDAAREGGVVMDGRDIGTAVFPDAEVKVFLVADPEERAKRRLAESGRHTTADAVHREADLLQARDRRDSTRLVAPLLQAEDAVLLDTTRLTFAEQVQRVVDLAQRATQGRT